MATCQSLAVKQVKHYADEEVEYVQKGRCFIACTNIPLTRGKPRHKRLRRTYCRGRMSTGDTVELKQGRELTCGAEGQIDFDVEVQARLFPALKTIRNDCRA